MSTSSPISLSGFSSGLPVNDIISSLLAVERQPITLLEQQKSKLGSQQTVYSNVKGRVTELLNSVKALTLDTSVLSTDVDLFKMKKATSANDAVATATASATSAAQKFTLEVVSLATQTKAVSTSPVAQVITAATPISQAALNTVTTGNFSVFANGNTYNIAVNVGETVGDVLARINTVVPEITVDPTIDPSGQVHITFADGTSVQLGGASDTSNFLTAMKLTTGVFTDLGGADSEIASQAPILALNPNVPIDGGASGTVTAVTSGTFTINGQSFDTTGKTLNEIISAINNSSAKVTAGFNATTNTFELTAQEPGSAMIVMADGTSNFLTAMGLITAGNSTASQTAGANAQFRINGGAIMYSPSNTVTDVISGITGVTLNFKSGNVGSPIQISIDKDNSQLEAGLDTFVKNFNNLLQYIDDQTKSDGEASKRGILSGESNLTRFRQELRQMVTSSVAGLVGTGFDSLPTAGISTGASTGVINNSTVLLLDKAKLTSALASNPDAIRQLFIGTTAADGFDGIMTQMEARLKDSMATNAVEGYDGLFSAWSDSSQARITSLNEAIKRGEERLARREEQLRKQFQIMESLIASYQSQGGALTALQNQLSANAKG